jgi:hypothetical protein
MVITFVPTVLKVRNIRIVIFTNDHPPPHVHALRGDARARFDLGLPDGDVRLVENEGFRLAEVRELGAAIARDRDAIAKRWSEIHGEV